MEARADATEGKTPPAAAAQRPGSAGGAAGKDSGAGSGKGHCETLLAPDVRAASAARTFLRKTLPLLPAEAVETLLLLTSEVVGNAVRHGAGPVRLQVEVQPAGSPVHVRVGVADEDPQPPRRRLRPEPGPADGSEAAVEDFPAESGRGVLLLDTLASRWGVDARPPGKQVWFELDLPG